MKLLTGERTVISCIDAKYPEALNDIENPPKRLYIIGNPDALQVGLAIVGARCATPYGLACTSRFGEIAAGRDITIVSGGARGIDRKAHEAALKMNAYTVAFLGGGCDRIYPMENFDLLQCIVDNGGAVVSEYEWDVEPRPFFFRARNRLIAGLSKAVLIPEVGLPSGTFATADYALAAGRDVWAVPGAITSPASKGTNRLIYQGAAPIIDDEVFIDQLSLAFT